MEEEMHMGSKIKKGDRFVNPYNFVSLGEACDKSPFISPFEQQEKTYTGYFMCELITKTPLFIPNTSNNKALHKAEERNNDNLSDSSSFEFFSYTNLKGQPVQNQPNYEPIIPGSEIRGAVRSVHEAAFNGCLSQVTPDKSLHRRTMDAKLAGILSFDEKEKKFKIQPCERVMLNVKKGHPEGKYVDKRNYREGEKVYIKKSPEPYKGKQNMPFVVDNIEKFRKEEDWLEGYIHIGEFFPRKHHESVFVPTGATSCTVAPEQIKAFLELLQMYKENEPPHEGYKRYREELGEGSINKIPVYYNEIKENQQTYPAYLSPANLSNEIFHQKVENLLKENGGYQPCTCRQNVCPSCALFGFVSKKASQSLASRVRFSDAKIEEKNGQYFKEPVVLPELGEPKPGTVEFYTKRNTETSGETRFWTYDYKTNGKVRMKLKPTDLTIRGRKFYWHHKPKNTTTKYALTNMRQRIRPLKENQVFSFRVYFENITDQELKTLQWALDFNDGNCAHKIGRGKPLGYGSVKIQLKRLVTRSVSENGEWLLNQYEPDPNCIGKWKHQDTEEQRDNRVVETTDQRDEILQIATFCQEIKDIISYPKGKVEGAGKNSEASHQWFTLNKQQEKQILPTIQEELSKNDDFHLKELYKISAKRSQT